MSRKSKFARIRECVGKKWFHGKYIRWIIANERGGDEDCIHCGNTANGVVAIKTDQRTYNLPFCKSHAAKLPNPPEFAPFYVEILKYKQRNNVRKHEKKSFTEWLKKN
jgi:hypothetical protein